MSTETHAALEAALTAHIADVTEGNVLTDYAIVAASVAMENIGGETTNYFFEGNVNQPPHVSYGILTYAINSAIWLDDDDDE